MLAWYDGHRRDLPWRAEPDGRADPYRVWLSEIMLQQTRVNVVLPYYAKFLGRWPTIHALAAASLEDVLRAWAGLGYYARARNLHACARTIVERHGGELPSEEAELKALPGIGPYTAAAIAAIAFERPATPIDGNIERVIARLFRVEAALPGAKPAIRRLAEALTPATRAGDFAQAMMDLGSVVCTPASPGCGICPWNTRCRARTDPESFPRRAARRSGTPRRGAAFFVLRKHSVLVRSRSTRGLLGGMTELPTTAWTETFEEAKALNEAPQLPPMAPQTWTWRRVAGLVRHVFSHFPLELTVYATEVPADTTAPTGMRFVALDRVHEEALPNVMRKVLALALGERSGAGGQIRLAPSRRGSSRAGDRSA